MPKNSFEDRRRNEAALSAEIARSLLLYDPLTGALLWKERAPTTKANRTFNLQFAGKPAGSVDAGGYLRIGLLMRRYLAHRVIWLIMTGEWPADHVDHRFGIGSDNRWDTLRAATQMQNGRNRAVAKNNRSGCSGVSFCNTHHKWISRITLNYREISLGSFVRLEDAVAARRSAEAVYYGEFAASVSRGESA